MRRDKDRGMEVIRRRRDYIMMMIMRLRRRRGRVVYLTEEEMGCLRVVVGSKILKWRTVARTTVGTM